MGVEAAEINCIGIDQAVCLSFRRKRRVLDPQFFLPSFFLDGPRAFPAATPRLSAQGNGGGGPDQRREDVTPGARGLDKHDKCRNM